MKKIIITLFLMALPCASFASKDKTTDAEIERLKIVWPSFGEMRPKDRNLLIGIAKTCKLENEEKAREPVLACLREGAQNPKVIVPKGFLKEVAPEKLEYLVKNAK